MIFGAVEINFAHFVYNLKRYYIYNIIQSSGKCQLVNSLIGTCLDSDIGKSSQTFYLVTLQGLHIMQYLTSHANVTSIALKCLNKEQPVALLPNSNWQFFQKHMLIFCFDAPQVCWQSGAYFYNFCFGTIVDGCSTDFSWISLLRFLSKPF